MVPEESMELICVRQSLDSNFRRVYEIDTQKKRCFHTNFVHFFEAVNYHTKKKLKRLDRVLYTQIK